MNTKHLILIVIIGLLVIIAELKWVAMKTGYTENSDAPRPKGGASSGQAGPADYRLLRGHLPFIGRRCFYWGSHPPIPLRIKIYLGGICPPNPLTGIPFLPAQRAGLPGIVSDTPIQEVGRRCLGASNLKSIQYKQIDFNTSLSVLDEYHLYRVWVNNIGSKPCLVVKSIDNDAWQMPTELEKVLKKEILVVSDPSLAHDIAMTYVGLTAPLGRIIVISNLDMIPDLNRNPLQMPLNEDITSVVIDTVSSGYRIHFFSWRELGGVIEKWILTIYDDASIQIESKELARHVGAAVGLQ